MKIPEWLKTTLSAILLALILVVGFMMSPPVKKPVSKMDIQNSQTLYTPAFTHPLTIGNKQIQVAYANTPELQEQGLSNTAPLTEEQGMLFMFPTETTPSFWMKDMNYALDIIWIDAGKKVIDITPNLDPKTFPRSYTPASPVQFILEVPAGFAEKNGITIGTKSEF